MYKVHMLASAVRKLLYGCAFVREIIYSLKLVDLPVHSHKPYNNLHMDKIQGCAVYSHPLCFYGKLTRSDQFIIPVCRSDICVRYMQRYSIKQQKLHFKKWPSGQSQINRVKVYSYFSLFLLNLKPNIWQTSLLAEIHSNNNKPYAIYCMTI